MPIWKHIKNPSFDIFEGAFEGWKQMLWLMLCILILANTSNCERSEPLPSISDIVRMGTTMVSRFLNSKSPQAFYSILNRGIKMGQIDENEATGNEVILLLLRLMGGNSQKITNFAFDGFISLAHLIIQILTKNGEKRRKGRSGFSLFRFILSQPQVSNLLTQMQDPKIIDLILEESEEKLKYFPEENADCIKILICRTKPFVHEMQRSLRFFMTRENIQTPGEGRTQKADEDVIWEKSGVENRMFYFMPSLQEVAESGDECEKRFSDCIY